MRAAARMLTRHAKAGVHEEGAWRPLPRHARASTSRYSFPSSLIHQEGMAPCR